MDKSLSSAINIVKQYLVELAKYNIRIKTAVLFGSYAHGTNNKWSDIDVALVSDDFVGIGALDAPKIARPTLNTDYRIAPITYKPEDFDESNLFVKEILKTGIRVK